MTSPAVSNLRILLVEDHQDTARMMARLLRIDGHIVDIAETLHDASAKCHQNHYDLLISDIELPDGFAYDLINADMACHGVKAIVVSGHGMAEHIERSRKAGFRAHLVKPFQFETLRAVVARAVAS